MRARWPKLDRGVRPSPPTWKGPPARRAAGQRVAPTRAPTSRRRPRLSRVSMVGAGVHGAGFRPPHRPPRRRLPATGPAMRVIRVASSESPTGGEAVAGRIPATGGHRGVGLGPCTARAGHERSEAGRLWRAESPHPLNRPRNREIPQPFPHTHPATGG